MIPLPEKQEGTAWITNQHGHAELESGYGYTADQMHAHAAAARRQALEEAAKRVDAAIGEAIAGHFNKQAISALMQTRDMLKELAA